MERPVETAGFANEYRKYLERPDTQITRDYHSFVADQAVYHGLIREAVEHSGAHPRVMEIGCGSGCTTAFMTTWFDGWYVASDILEGSLACAKRTLTLCRSRVERVRFMVADGTRLPWADGQLHVLFHQGLMEHFHDPAPLWREAHRVLAPGGYVVINVPQHSWYTVKKWWLRQRGRWAPGWETQFSTAQLRALGVRHGFTLIKAKGQGWDSKWSELRKGYKKMIRPWVPKGWDRSWTAGWHALEEQRGDRWMVEVVALFQRQP